MTERLPWDRVREEISAPAVADFIGLEKGKEPHKWGPCPSCGSSETPALHAYPESGQGFFCFSCGNAWTVIDMAAAVWKIPSPEACEWLARAFGIPVEGDAPVALEPPSLTLEQYAEHFQLDPVFLARLGVRTATDANGRALVEIPYLDSAGNEVAIRQRISLNGGNRFLWRRGDKPCLYGLPRLKRAREAGHVVLVEGESDCHTLWFHEYPAVGLPGAGQWKEERDAGHLDGISTVYVVEEPDQAGRQLVRKFANSAIADQVRVVRLQGAKDPAQLHRQAPEGFAAAFEAALGAARPITEVALEVAAEADLPLTTGGRFRFLDDVEIENLPPIEWVVDGVIPASGLVVIYGKPGAAKGFLAMDLAFSVATATPWAGRTVKPGPVAYIVAEGFPGIPKRVVAWKVNAGWTGLAGVYFLKEPVSFLDPDNIRELIAALETLPDPPRLMIVDTLARTIVPGDENATKDMSAYTGACARIQHATGATVVVLHHNRAADEKERGNTALRGAADVMIWVEKTRDLVTIQCTKMRDAEEFEGVYLKMVPSMQSCALESPTAGLDIGVEGLAGNERRALESLARDFFEDGASSSDWMAACELPRSSFYAARKPLCVKGFVKRIEEGKRVRYLLSESGKAVIGPAVQPQSSEGPMDSSVKVQPAPPLYKGAGLLDRPDQQDSDQPPPIPPNGTNQIDEQRRLEEWI